MRILYTILNSSYWGVVNNFLAAIGILSIVLTFLCFIHNRRLKVWKSNVSIEDFAADYDVELEYRNAIYSKIWTENLLPGITTIVFRPVNCIIPKLKVYALDYRGRKGKLIETFTNLTPDDAVCFRLERAECIPQFKIRWYAEYGEYAEHELSDNLRNGINTVDGIQYHTNIITLFRRALDLR